MFDSPGLSVAFGQNQEKEALEFEGNAIVLYTDRRLHRVPAKMRRPSQPRLGTLLSIRSCLLCLHALLFTVSSLICVQYRTSIMARTALFAPADSMWCLHSSTMTPKVHYARLGHSLAHLLSLRDHSCFLHSESPSQAPVPPSKKGKKKRKIFSRLRFIPTSRLLK